uniref:Uncharacterized protein n=1 Tax=Triticum urartu TaxID=4572 RepID=A0A8R7U4J7_TRIUA
MYIARKKKLNKHITFFLPTTVYRYRILSHALSTTFTATCTSTIESILLHPMHTSPRDYHNVHTHNNIKHKQQMS